MKPSLAHQYVFGAALEQLAYWLLHSRQPDPWVTLYLTMGMIVPLVFFKPWVTSNSKEVARITGGLRPGTPVDYASQVKTLQELGGDQHKRKLAVYVALQQLWALLSGYLLMWIASPIIIWIVLKG